MFIKQLIIDSEKELNFIAMLWPYCQGIKIKILELLLYALMNVIYAIIAIPAGLIMDRVGKKRVILIGLTLLLIVGVILIFPVENLSGIWPILIVILIFILFGVYFGIVDTGTKAMVSDLTQKNKKGRLYGMYYLMVGILSIPEALLFAWIYERFGYSFAFSYLSLLLLLSIILFGMVKFPRRKESK